LVDKTTNAKQCLAFLRETIMQQQFTDVFGRVLLSKNEPPLQAQSQ
jgi:hypothetical protein